MPSAIHNRRGRVLIIAVCAVSTWLAAQPMPRQRQLDGPSGPPDPARQIERLDRDGDGRISRSEAPERMQSRFPTLDTNGDGFLSLAELQARNDRLQRGGGDRAGIGRRPPGRGPIAVAPGRPPGLNFKRTEAFDGYTLLAPLGSTRTYLLDNDGRIVHRWESAYRPGNAAYLLPNGNLLRTANPGREAATAIEAGGAGGIVQEFSWDGELVWEYELCNDDQRLHHDIERLPNGNTLMIAWERISKEKAIAAGRDSDLLRDGELWSERILEVKKTGARGGEIVWQWNVWDWLIQDFDPKKPNNGDPARHPDRIDVNHVAAGGPARGGADWLHINAVAYNAERNEILLTVHGFDEIWVISREKDSGLLYRWGNPAAYGHGAETDQVLFAQHDAHWIADGLPGAGNVLIFDNGLRRPQGRFSTVVEVTLPCGKNGGYRRQADGAFAPAAVVWTYTATPKEDFYSQNISGAQRLPNGNTLICSGTNGTIFEVTPQGESVWQYVNPVTDAPPEGPRPGGRAGGRGDRRAGPGRPPMGRPGTGPAAMGPPGRGGRGGGNPVFRAYRYAKAYPAFAGKALSPKGALTEGAEQKTGGERALSPRTNAPRESVAPTVPAKITGSARVFVRAGNRSKKQDGTNWTTAFARLQDGIDAAADRGGGEVWVAAGTYVPTTDSDRNATFQLRPGVGVYGGFLGDETRRDERNFVNNATILSGDIGRANDDTDNAYHVVTGADNALLDGFVVTAGNCTRGRDGATGSRPADPRRSGRPPNAGRLAPPPEGGPGGPPDGGVRGEAPRGRGIPGSGAGGGQGGIHTTPQRLLASGGRASGAGMLNLGCAPTVRNCVFRNNQAMKGGGMYNMVSRGFPPNRQGGGSPAALIENCTFETNVAIARGGGVSNDLNTNPTFRGCVFRGNRCDEKGGGMYNDFGCSPILVNCLFAGNRAFRAAAIGNDGASNPVLVCCTITRNEAEDAGAGLYQGTGPANNPTVIRCIVWGNLCENGPADLYNWHDNQPRIIQSCIGGGYAGEGNIDADPCFAAPDRGDFSLRADSPCPRAGHLATAPETIPAPIAPSRFRRGGPSPKTAKPSSLLPAQSVVRVHVDSRASNPDGKTWATAYRDLQAAIDHAWRSNGEVWVARGTYRPDGRGRQSSFQLRPGVGVYGGFAGTETQRKERNSAKNITVLSGDIGKANDAIDNCFHVVIGADEAVLDGFTIEGGMADGMAYDAKGGGMINYLRSEQGPPMAPPVGYSPIVRNCAFHDNHAREGGAVYNYDRGTPVFENCTFSRNSADNGGALLDRVGVKSTIIKCRFEVNSARYRGGAVYFDYGSRPKITDTVFEENTSKVHGGAVYCISRASQLENTQPTFAQCVFLRNRADKRGGAIANADKCLLTVEESRFVANHAGAGGGAIANDYRTRATVRQCRFANNSVRAGKANIDTDSTSVCRQDAQWRRNWNRSRSML